MAMYEEKSNTQAIGELLNQLVMTFAEAKARKKKKAEDAPKEEADLRYKNALAAHTEAQTKGLTAKDAEDAQMAQLMDQFNKSQHAQPTPGEYGYAGTQGPVDRSQSPYPNQQLDADGMPTSSRESIIQRILQNTPTKNTEESYALRERLGAPTEGHEPTGFRKTQLQQEGATDRAGTRADTAANEFKEDTRWHNMVADIRTKGLGNAQEVARINAGGKATAANIYITPAMLKEARAQIEQARQELLMERAKVKGDANKTKVIDDALDELTEKYAAVAAPPAAAPATAKPAAPTAKPIPNEMAQFIADGKKANLSDQQIADAWNKKHPKK